MVAVSITIQSFEDAENGKPLAEGLKEVPRECEKFSVGILEKGTVEGKHLSCSFARMGTKQLLGGQSI